MRVTMSPYTVIATVVGGLLTVILRPVSYARYIKQVRITGPTGTSFNLYLGNVSQQPFDTTSRGDSNQQDYANPVTVPAGYTVFGQWNTGAGVASATFLMDREV